LSAKLAFFKEHQKERCMFKKTLKFLGACVLVTLAQSTLAVDKAALLDKIRAQSSEYSEFKELLNSPDQSVRFAAFDAMFNSGDPVLKEMAVDEALAYPDVTLQSVAFREIIMSLDVLSFQLKLPEGADKKTANQVASLSEAITYKLNDKDVAAGRIVQCNHSGSCLGQVSGLQLSIKSSCKLAATLSEGAQLKGLLSCKNMMPIPVTANLR